ncbi:MAG TPA: glycoside hydrolase family 2 TIM barrel-domain containing protein [Planctomycetota bacterium]|nr:glycoside hydrolase family 2 TIM barrel-domain containing protein [Planctomycetota bacterium]
MSIPRPEYPRPDLVRQDWLNLNGEWQFAFDDQNEGLRSGWISGRDFEQRITVPFPYQAKLSGIGKREIHHILWYRRIFSVPDGWYGRRIRLNFGAVDFECSVYVNGKLVGTHRGGNTPFSFDITCCLNLDNRNELVLRVYDDERLSQPRGKQYWIEESGGIWYTRSSGIWQTVWIEPVGTPAIERLHVQSWNVDGHVQVDALFDGPADNVRVRAEAFFDGRSVAIAEGSALHENPAGTHFRTVRLQFQIPSPRLWTVDKPDLYQLKLTVVSNGATVDEVQSYFGIRSLRVEHGTVLMNGKAIYQRLILDQGYWPDGLITAPSDEELKADILRMKEMGFNGCRKHMKAEDPRFLFWADTLGYFVWGEMAAPWEYTDQSVEFFTAEWQEAVIRDRNHPCIITWTPINESWGVVENMISVKPEQIAFLCSLYYLTKALDPTRPVNGNDGWQNPLTDLATVHDYTQHGDKLRKHFETYVRNPLVAVHFPPFLEQHLPGHPYRGQPILCTEYGGVGLAKEGQAWGYGNLARNPEELLERFRDLTWALQDVPEIVGYCYTQLSDVEQEQNGLYTYDRKPKLDPAKVREVNERRK